MALERTVTGLLHQNDFASLSGWTDADSQWSNVAAPAFVVFNPSPNVLLTGGTNGQTDYSGAREGQLFIDSNNTWWLLYDGGDNVTNWLQFLAYSTDRGLSWTKQGAVSMGYDDGNGGTVIPATGWLEKRGSTYYLYRVTTTNAFAAPNVGLPAIPYQGDVWSATSLSGAWTFVRSWVGVPGGWSQNQDLPGSVYFDGTTYHLFSQGALCTGRKYSNNVGGPWTIDPTIIIDTEALGMTVENPKVFYHPGLARYVMLLNAHDGAIALRSLCLLSTSLTDWSAATQFLLQFVGGDIDMDGTVALGVPAHVTRPDGSLVVEADGYLPFTYDSDPPTNHLFRSIRHAVLEPSSHALQFNNDAAPVYPYSPLWRTLAHTDFIAEFTVQVGAATGAASDIGSDACMGLFFRHDGANAGYMLSFGKADKPRLWKVVAGVPSSLAVGGGVYVPYWGVNSRVQLSVIGTAIKVWVDGALHIDHTDATYASGTTIGFWGNQADGGQIRHFHMRKAAAVTIAGAPASGAVALRGAGGLSFTTGTANGSGVGSLSQSHYPMHYIEIGGVNYSPDDDGLVWGGDSFTLVPEPEPDSDEEVRAGGRRVFGESSAVQRIHSNDYSNPNVARGGVAKGKVKY